MSIVHKKHRMHSIKLMRQILHKSMVLNKLFYPVVTNVLNILTRISHHQSSIKTWNNSTRFYYILFTIWRIRSYKTAANVRAERLIDKKNSRETFCHDRQRPQKARGPSVKTRAHTLSPVPQQMTATDDVISVRG